MTLVDLISREAADERLSILLAATLAGIANALALAFINAIARAPGSADIRSFAIILLAVLLYVLCARRTYRRTTDVVETSLHRIKVRIVGKIERAELEGLERTGTTEIYDRITENASVISDSAWMIANLLQSVFIIVFATLLLAWLSPPTFAVFLLLETISVAIYLSNRNEIDGYLRQAGQVRLAFFDLLTDLLKGFKEVKLSRDRGRELREDIVQTSEALRTATIRADDLFNEGAILANCTLTVMACAPAVIFLQGFLPEPSMLGQLVSIIMFLWIPIEGIVGGYPAMVRSNMALEQIDVLEEKLDAAARKEVPPAKALDPWGGRFTVLSAVDVEYRYASPNSGGRFHIGPLRLDIRAGEVVFIVGGNGSGKSTLLKVLTGLYRPTAGALWVGDTLVQPDNVAAYREMISAIFSDFHLFNKLYGLLGIEDAPVRSLLEQMQLDGETSFANQRFTKRDLSTGQRKRLAMIVALLEDRPIYVFDEWAADQDPEFRRYFYEELIPALTRRGKTVIAVSHDDRYFHGADRVVTMEYGTIRSIEVPPRR